MIMMGAATMIIGTAILTSSTTRAQLYIGRVITGIVSARGSRRSSILLIYRFREMVLIHLPFLYTNRKLVVVLFVVP